MKITWDRLATWIIWGSFAILTAIFLAIACGCGEPNQYVLRDGPMRALKNRAWHVKTDMIRGPVHLPDGRTVHCERVEIMAWVDRGGLNTAVPYCIEGGDEDIAARQLLDRILADDALCEKEKRP